MYQRQRRKIVGIIVLISTVFVIYLTNNIEIASRSTELYSFYLKNFVKDTGANNAVSGIMLNYRLFDTFFEALLLMLSVIGIIHFSTHEDEH